MTKTDSFSQYDRRSFLKVSALAGGGMFLGVQLISGQVSAQATSGTDLASFNAFVKIYPDGRIVIMSPNPEIGQGVKTAMPMIVAEELDADWSKVTVEQAPLDTTLFTRQVAGGSGSIKASWIPLRKAGASARALLVMAAARQWQVEPGECVTENSIVKHPSSGRQLGYGELATLASTLSPPSDVPLKDPAAFRLLGKYIPNADNHGIVTGEKLYGSDLKREGMLVAVVARPPAFGKKLAAVDDGAAKAMPGVQQVIRFGNKVAVLANTTWEAKKAGMRLCWNGRTKQFWKIPLTTTRPFRSFWSVPLPVHTARMAMRFLHLPGLRAWSRLLMSALFFLIMQWNP